jgi:hypothetical protein
MPREKRASAFLFEPLAFLNDPAVLAMDECAVGAYATLLFSLWDMPEPGVIYADDKVLATLSRTGTRWGSYREAVERAFDTASRPGFWVSSRMVATHLVQRKRIFVKKRAGKASAKRRWDNKVSRSPITDPMGTQCRLGVGVGVVGFGESKEQAGGGPFRNGLLAELRSKHPARDVDLIAAKLIEYQRSAKKPYSNLDVTLLNWCSLAEKRDTERLREGAPDDTELLPWAHELPAHRA